MKTQKGKKSKDRTSDNEGDLTEDEGHTQDIEPQPSTSTEEGPDTIPEDTEESRPYIIEKTTHTRIRKFGIEEFLYQARFKEGLQGNRVADIKDDLHRMFADIMNEVSV